MKKIVLVGGGGHCKSCIQIVEETGSYEILGILDLPDTLGMKILGYEITGTDSEIDKFDKKTTGFLVTVGQIKTADLRRRLYEFLCRVDVIIETVVAKNAVISRHADIGRGTIIMNNTLVNSNSVVGVNCIINNFSNIEHDVIVSDHCHISTGAMINGNVTVGSNAFIGSGAVISNGVTLCDYVLIGAGSVVLKDIHKPGVYAGNPARFIREL